jgi:hypothetical protein
MLAISQDLGIISRLRQAFKILRKAILLGLLRCCNISFAIPVGPVALPWGASLIVLFSS